MKIEYSKTILRLARDIYRDTVDEGPQERFGKLGALVTYNKYYWGVAQRWFGQDLLTIMRQQFPNVVAKRPKGKTKHQQQANLVVRMLRLFTASSNDELQVIHAASALLIEDMAKKNAAADATAGDTLATEDMVDRIGQAMAQVQYKPKGPRHRRTKFNGDAPHATA